MTRNSAKSDKPDKPDIKQRSPREQTKVVVRGLPPMLTETAFLEIIERAYKTPGNQPEIAYNWCQYWPGKVTKKQQVIYSRAYLNFDCFQHVQVFAKIFNNHKFFDTQGRQFQCTIEMAPFQKIPKEKKKQKKDPREGTIDKDPEFKAFVAQLEEEQKPKPSAEIWLAKKEAAEKEREEKEGPKSNVIVTPLMQHLREKYAAKLAKKASGGQGSSRGQGRGSRNANCNNHNNNQEQAQQQSYNEEQKLSSSNSGHGKRGERGDKKSGGKSGKRDRRERGGGGKEVRETKDKRIGKDVQVGEVKLKQKQNESRSIDSKEVDDVVRVEFGGRGSRGQGKSGKGSGGGKGGSSQTMRWVPKPG